MTYKNFLKSLKNKWEAVVIITIITGTIGLYINFFLPHYYSATNELLIVQKQRANLDAYTAIKGSEQLAYTLKQIITSPTFFSKVTSHNPSIQNEYFGKNIEDQLKKWHKLVKVETLANTGILKISTFHTDQRQVLEISQSIKQNVQKNYPTFLGSEEQLDIVSLGNPVVSEKFVKPNALINTFIGFVIGLLASIGLVVAFPDKKISFAEKETAQIKQRKGKQKKYLSKKNYKSNQPFIKKVSAPSNLPTLQ